MARRVLRMTLNGQEDNQCSRVCPRSREYVRPGPVKRHLQALSASRNRNCQLQLDDHSCNRAVPFLFGGLLAQPPVRFVRDRQSNVTHLKLEELGRYQCQKKRKRIQTLHFT